MSWLLKTMADHVKSWHGGQVIMILIVAGLAEWWLFRTFSMWGGISDIAGVSIQDTIVIATCAVLMPALGLAVWCILWVWFGSRAWRRRSEDG